MLGVYNNMTLALAISGLVSLGISMNTALMAAIWKTPDWGVRQEQYFYSSPAC